MGRQGRSKRKRKAKDMNSLRQKSGAGADTNACVLGESGLGGLLDDGLAASLQTGGGGQLVVGGQDEGGGLETGCQAGGAQSAGVGLPQPRAKKLSKSQQRKLRKIQEEKEKREKRQRVLETLSKHQLDVEETSMLRTVASRGQQESKKQLATRVWKMERAGLEVPQELRDLVYGDAEVGVEGEGDVYRGRACDDGVMRSAGETSTSDVSDEESEGVPPASLAARAPPVQMKSRREVAACDESAGVSGVAGMGGDADEGTHLSKEELGAAVAVAKKEIEACGDLPGPDDDQMPKRQSSIKIKTALLTVAVQRPAEIEEVRSSLPICGMEQEIMEAVSDSDVLVLCGETGCGKTTQVPQFLYEAGYCFGDGLIGVTQPRRVAAVSTATRVAEELGNRVGRGIVGYHVRYDRKVSDDTRVQFMTDGILLREVQDDFLLRKYNAIIIDEAHERSLNTDVLLGMLSRIVSLRRQIFEDGEGDAKGKGSSVAPLKLIIMSATLRVGDFVENEKLFRVPPPVINVQARQYPVAVHFQKKTELDDYVGAAFKKTCQIHRKLPDGGVLVFLTGQREVELLCSKLRETFNGEHRKQRGGRRGAGEGAVGLADAVGALDGLDAGEEDIASNGPIDDANDLDDYDIDGDMEEFEDSVDDENAEEEKVEIINGGEDDLNELLKLDEVDDDEPAKKVWVLPLYAVLKPEHQTRVFQAVPEGHRLIVVATNIAETSLTIPGIRYVVDAGRSKQRLLDTTSGLARFEVRWVSKASADQRAGRSGRVGPGHCYRIYSSAVFNDLFPQFSPPEIHNVALEGVVLLLKSIGVDNVVNFPFPSPPEGASLRAAQKCLVALSAVDKSDGSLTKMGRAMAQLPVSPRHSRMLLEILNSPDVRELAASDSSSVDVLIMFAVRLAAAMSLESPFMHVAPGAAQGDPGNNGIDEEGQPPAKLLRSRHASLRVPDSDSLSAMKALCAFEDNGGTGAFCEDNFLVFKHLREGLQLTRQLERILQSSNVEFFSRTIQRLGDIRKPKLSTGIIIALKRSILAGWGDHVSRRVRSAEYLAKKRREGSRTRAVRYESTVIDEDVFLHPSSALHSRSPEWLVYSDIISTEKRPYMVGLTSIEPAWIQPSVPQLCTTSFDKTSGRPPLYNASQDRVMAWHNCSYGSLAQPWELPHVLLPLENDDRERAAIFAMAVLDGTVLPWMKKHVKELVAPPSTMASTDMRVHRRAHMLIEALLSKRVFSKRELSTAWQREPTFLENEMAAWFQKKAQAAFLKSWPQIRL